MRLKIYRSPTMAEAMAQLRAELGADAFIVSTRRSGQLIELVAAHEPMEEAPAPPPPPTQPPVDFAFHAIPPEIATQLANGDLTHALQAVLRFGPLPLQNADARPLLLTGAPGAGKTLTIARLATRLVLAGHAPLVITADGRRAGAPEELAAYTRLLGLNLLVAGTPGALRRALAQRKHATPVLIDTSGINATLAAEREQIEALLQASQALPVLVMPAGLHADEAAEHAAFFAPLGVRHLLPTRLDMSRRLGSIIAAAVGSNLILTEAGIGNGATDSLTELTPQFLADRLRFPAAHLAPAPPPAQASAPPRAPLFPTARARAASSWTIEGYEHDGA